MKFSLNLTNKDFYKSISNLSSIIDNKSPLEILTTVKVVAKDNTVTFTTTDLETYIIYTFDANVVVDGSCLIKPKELQLFNNLLGLVHFELKGNDILLSLEPKGLFDKDIKEIAKLNNLYKIEDYPLTPESNTDTVDIQTNKLLTMFKYVKNSASTHDVRYYFEGVLLEQSQNELISTATNGHILSNIRYPLETDQTTKSILANGSVRVLCKCLKSGTTTISCGDNVIFNNNNVCIICNPIDATYADYNRVIPDLDTYGLITLDTKKVLANLKQLKKSLAKGVSDWVDITIQGHKVTLATKGSSSGYLVCINGLKNPDKDKIITINIDYLITAFSTLTTKQAIIGLFEGSGKEDYDYTGILIKEVSDTEQLHIIMPIKK